VDGAELVDGADEGEADDVEDVDDVEAAAPAWLVRGSIHTAVTTLPRT
jgi:hypothetical protein